MELFDVPRKLDESTLSIIACLFAYPGIRIVMAGVGKGGRALMTRIRDAPEGRRSGSFLGVMGTRAATVNGFSSNARSAAVLFSRK